MVQKIKKLCSFFRMVDSDGQLSLTNLAVLIVLIKTSILPSTIVDVGALLVTLLNYTSKKIIQKQNENEVDPLKNEVDALTARLDEMTSKVNTLSMNVGFKK